MSLDFLTPDTAALAELCSEERIATLHVDCWIGYTRAETARLKLERLFVHPTRQRMPNMLLCGVTNNGKSSIINRFLADHPTRSSETGDAEEVPVLHVEAPSGPDARRFYTNLLRRMVPDYPATRALHTKEADAIHHLRRVRTRLLVIDEIHNILSGKRDQVRQFLNLIRFLGNELRIPLVGVGTKDALATMAAADQTANRFEPFALPRWRPGEEYLTLLDSFEAILPLRKPSDLSSPSLAERILAMSEGVLGEIATILNRAAEAAILSGKERIDAAVLREIGFVPPSQRRHEADLILAD